VVKVEGGFVPSFFCQLSLPLFSSSFKYLVVVFNVKMNNHLPAKFLESTASNGIMKNEEGRIAREKPYASNVASNDQSRGR